MNQSLYALVERLVSKGKVLQAEFIAVQGGMSQRKLQALIDKYKMGDVKRVYG